MDNLK